MTLDSVSGTNSVDRFVGRGSREIAAKVTTSFREHVIDGNSASSVLLSSFHHKQLNGSKIIVAGATMEDSHRNLASDGSYLTFVIFS